MTSRKGVRETSKETRIAVRRGGANVFADLGLPDAETHLVKAELVSRMMDIMKARKLTQRAVADMVGLTQPDVSNLIRGRFRGYSLERLMGLLVALDQEVEIVVRDKPTSRKIPSARRASISSAA